MKRPAMTAGWLALAFLISHLIPCARADDPGLKPRLLDKNTAVKLVSVLQYDQGSGFASVSEEYGKGMEESGGREFEQGVFELRLSCWVWYAQLEGRTKVSSGDLRLAQALRNLETFDTAVTSIDVVDEMELAKNRMIINPELGLRLYHFAMRLSWWRFLEESSVHPGKIYAFGDVVYARDVDGAAISNRVPPDGAPSPLDPVDITFTTELMDTKLILEGRLKATKTFEAYAGMAVHWLRYRAQANTTERVFTAIRAGALIDRDPVDDLDQGDYPLVSGSVRIEWRPHETYYFTLDVQEMYLYVGNYTDLRVAAWNQILPYVRVGVGWRLWNMQVELYELGNNKHNIDVNVTLSGFWAGLHIII